jgi:hypothetical protein
MINETVTLFNKLDLTTKQKFAKIKKRICDCGFNPNKKSKKTDEHCSIKLPLLNHLSFPSLKMLPDTEEINDLFYDTVEGSPKFHWCLFIQIEEKIDATSWLGFTGFFEKVTLILQNESEERLTSFSWDDLKKGNTVAILYAEKTQAKVIETCLDYVFVFKASGKEVFEEATKLLINQDLLSKKISASCFHCGISADSSKLSRCTKCLQSKYCSKECQRDCWKGAHKMLCPQSETLLKLASLPRNPFEKHVDFTISQENSLPPYIYKEEFDFFVDIFSQSN